VCNTCNQGIITASYALLVKSSGKLEGRRFSLAWRELLGFVGGALTTAAFIPQVWLLFKLKSAREISLPFTSLFILGVVCWLVYGILWSLLPVVLWNAISLVVVCAMLYAKLKYGK
jgi:MtN3 and saliva related transmembrane protein